MRVMPMPTSSAYRFSPSVLACCPFAPKTMRAAGYRRLSPGALTYRPFRGDKTRGPWRLIRLSGFSLRFASRLPSLLCRFCRLLESRRGRRACFTRLSGALHRFASSSLAFLPFLLG